MKSELLRAVAAANDDGEFRIAARMWNASLSFGDGAETVGLAVRDGVLGRDQSNSSASAEIRVVGPAEGWEKMLRAVPPPFYQDLYGAMLHHGFWLGGNLESAYAYYPALRRLIELMRKASTEGK